MLFLFWNDEGSVSMWRGAQPRAADEPGHDGELISAFSERSGVRGGRQV